MSRNSDRMHSVLGKLAAFVPEPIRMRGNALVARFQSAPRRTRVGIGGGAGVLLVTLLVVASGEDGVNNSAVTFTARRGDLDITVLEGGALEALQSQEIRSMVKGREGVKILSIVEEGYRVSDADVDSGKILVELDTSALIDEKLNQEIAVETAEASFIEQKAEYEIQLNQNMTELNEARQNMRFARLDFEKFLGANIVTEIIAELEIEERLARAEAAQLAGQQQSLPSASAPPMQPEVNPALRTEMPVDIESLPAPMQDRIRQMLAENNGEIPAEMLQRMQRFASGDFPRGGPDTGQRRRAGGGRQADDSLPTSEPADVTAGEPDTLTLSDDTVAPSAQVTPSMLMDESYMMERDQLDFTQYADITQLEDGEAKQMLRALLDELQVAQEEYLLAQDRIEGQRRLESRGFITPTELEAEELNLNKAFNKQQEKETALALYIQYTFPKEAEQKLSDFENAVMAYQRQLIDNVAEEAQQRARFRSAERKYNLEKVKLVDVNEQIE
ncbi:unnamed protein product, partial [Discosporangium mesarthrocarpum]